MALFFHRLESTKKSRIFKEKASFYQFIINNPHYNSYIIYIYLNIKEKIQNLEKNFFSNKKPAAQLSFSTDTYLQNNRQKH